MNQVRLLAQDCNNCITTYRYYGDPDIHRARDGLRRYIWWLPWFVKGDAPAERRSVLPCGGARVCGVAGALRADLVIRSLPGAARGLGPARRGGWPVADRGRRTGVAGLGRGRGGGGGQVGRRRRGCTPGRLRCAWEELGAWDGMSRVRDVRVGNWGTDDIRVFSWAELTLGLMG